MFTFPPYSPVYSLKRKARPLSESQVMAIRERVLAMLENPAVRFTCEKWKAKYTCKYMRELRAEGIAAGNWPKLESGEYEKNVRKPDELLFAFVASRIAFAEIVNWRSFSTDDFLLIFSCGTPSQATDLSRSAQFFGFGNMAGRWNHHAASVASTLESKLGEDGLTLIRKLGWGAEVFSR